MRELSRNDGFTLMEMMIAMVIASILIFTMTTLHSSQSRLSNAQQQITEMQQTARAAMYYMVRDIRHAGLDPRESSGAGFDVTFSGAQMLSNHIAFSLDDDESGTIDANASEQIAYRLNGTRLETFTGAGWFLVADNVEALNFVYLDMAGNPTNVASAVRSVQVTLVVRSQARVPSLSGIQDSAVYLNQQDEVMLDAANDQFRRIRLTANVFCRNLAV